MARDLKVSIGQYSDRGRKAINQDFHGAMIPLQPALGLKGIAVGLADGISSSAVSQIASESAVSGFLLDYYCTSDSWSVKTSAQRVIAATNPWLHAQTRRGRHRYDPDNGHICTLDVVVFKARAAHIFHIGDARVYRLSGRQLEQLTDDHRVVVSSQETYLSRALGVNPQIEIDYRAVPLEPGDVFILATDGVHEHIPHDTLPGLVTDDLDTAAKTIATAAHDRGSADNLTVQLVRIDELPDAGVDDVLGQATALPSPPLLQPRMVFDGYDIVRQVHASSRSHIYLASDQGSGAQVALKIPSIDLRDDADYRRRLLMEEWIARRIDNAHVLRAGIAAREKHFLYTVTEFLEGQTLAQWIADNPRPDLETVRGIVEQIATGLQAFHRLEMVHQDLRPENIMIDRQGTVKIIDFGSTRIAGVHEAAPVADGILGTVQYAAPEYLLGDGGSAAADIFSLGVITYQMLTGALPYGAQMAQARTRVRQRKIPYRSVRTGNRTVPEWVDRTLRQAVHPDPARRYQTLSAFTYDLRHPDPAFVRAEPVPLIERNPLLFWQAVSAILACLVLLLLLHAARQ